jgi:cell division protein FtsX
MERFMTINPNSQPEATLQDVSEDLQGLAEKIDRLSSEQEKFNDRFANYQQATQWVVQLAFSLIASATVLVIITTVFKR